MSPLVSRNVVGCTVALLRSIGAFFHASGRRTNPTASSEWAVVLCSVSLAATPSKPLSNTAPRVQIQVHRQWHRLVRAVVVQRHVYLEWDHSFPPRLRATAGVEHMRTFSQWTTAGGTNDEFEQPIDRWCTAPIHGIA